MEECSVKIYNGSGFPDPDFESEGASGIDLRAAIEKPLILWPGTVTIVPTGISCEIEQGFEAQVRARSGLALKHGISLVNGIGTIDSDYRGEISVILINLKKSCYTVKPGDRIAQLVFVPVARPVFTRVSSAEELQTTERGAGGFGHSGKN
ncbi:MAG: dUTP diphosphatase [Eubacteriaceae bacterium]|jgi:dUTP pyrophosphatase